jgi:hypothetical protein
MKARIFFVAVLIALFCAASLSYADVPHMINYQGYLTDNTGAPVTGTVGLTFRIYDDPAAGNLLWDEYHASVSVDDGIFSVLLGGSLSNPEPLDPGDFNGDIRYLEMQVDGDPQPMSPRKEMVSVPYAFRAYAADQADNDWEVSGGNVFTGHGGIYPSGNVGIGTANPQANLEIYQGSPGNELRLSGQGSNQNGTFEEGEIIGRISIYQDDYYHQPDYYNPRAILEAEAQDEGFWRTGTDLIFKTAGSNVAEPDERMRITKDGKVGIGTTTPAEKLDVVGNIHASGSIVSGSSIGVVPANSPPGFPDRLAANGQVIYLGYEDPVNSGIGAGTIGIARYGNTLYGTQTKTHINLGVSSTTGIISGNLAYCTVGGGYNNMATREFTTVGGGQGNQSNGHLATIGGGSNNIADGTLATIGGGGSNTASGADVVVSGGMHNNASRAVTAVGGGAYNTASGVGAVVPGGENNTAAGDHSLAAGKYVNITSDADNTFAFGYNFTTSASHAVIFHDTNTPIKVGIGTTAPTAKLDVESDQPLSWDGVIRGRYTGTAMQDIPAIVGRSTPGDYYGVGGVFEGGYLGVLGKVFPTGNLGYYGLWGIVNGGSGINGGVYGYAEGSGYNYGVRAVAAGSGTKYGVWAQASGASSYAGYFEGDVHVTGTLSKAAGSFKIDHPLDPENKYLYHSFVQSPDMMNVYNGNVILDANGEAQVELPDYFEALNRDFRYQLTCIGGFAPVYVAEKVSRNRFKIAGGEPGMELSWQVTGIRKDAFAEANRIEVEVDKPAKERGKYLHPEAHGLGEEHGIHYEEQKRMDMEMEKAGVKP